MNLFVGSNLVIELPNEPMFKFWDKGNAVLHKLLLEALPELAGPPVQAILNTVYVSGIQYSTQAAAADIVVDGKLQCYYVNFTLRVLVSPFVRKSWRIMAGLSRRLAIWEKELRF